MSPSSRESELAQLREALAQSDSEFFLNVADRRKLTLRIQGLREKLNSFQGYDPDREKEIFLHFAPTFKSLTLKEMLSFSLLLEDHGQALAPGSYPSWSSMIHLSESTHELFEMINPLMLKISRPEIYKRLKLHPDFSFLKDF